MAEEISASPREATLGLIEDLWRRAVAPRPAEGVPARLHVGALAWAMLCATVARGDVAGRSVAELGESTHMFGVPVVVGQPPSMTTLLPPRGWALVSAAGTVMSQGVLGDA